MEKSRIRTKEEQNNGKEQKDRKKNEKKNR